MFTRKTIFSALAVMGCLAVNAQNLTIKGVHNNMRYDDGDDYKSTYIGSLVDENGHYILNDKGYVVTAFIVDQGIYKMTWDGTTLTTPEKEPAVNLSDIKQGSKVNVDKAIWANNFSLMVGNSGAAYVDGKITTVMSRDYQSTPDEELFAVRKWDATTGNLLSASDDYYPASANLESAGMAYNPMDGKVYGLFYVSAASLPEDILADYTPDQDDTDFDREGVDAGYAIGTINLNTMKVDIITPGLYYGNFITFAINSEGRAFALTSGGGNGYLDDEGRQRDAENKLSGARLHEFDLTTGLMKTKAQYVQDETSGEIVTEYVNKYDEGTGYPSQYRRQAACFAKSNPGKMYWAGYYNSGKGINDYGSWSSLSDREWRTNGKYDTALYEIDIETGKGTRLSKIGNRIAFSCIWVDGDDLSDGSNYEVMGVENVPTQSATAATRVYNLAGQQVSGRTRGMQIVRQGDMVRKVMVK